MTVDRPHPHFHFWKKQFNTSAFITFDFLPKISKSKANICWMNNSLIILIKMINKLFSLPRWGARRRIANSWRLVKNLFICSFIRCIYEKGTRQCELHVCLITFICLLISTEDKQAIVNFVMSKLIYMLMICGPN